MSSAGRPAGSEQELSRLRVHCPDSFVFTASGHPGLYWLCPLSREEHGGTRASGGMSLLSVSVPVARVDVDLLSVSLPTASVTNSLCGDEAGEARAG